MRERFGAYVVLFIVFAVVGAIFTHVGPTIEQGAETTGPTLPSSFEIQEQSSFGTTKMSLVGHGETLGTVNEKANGNLMTFEYRDMAQRLIASAQAQNGTWATTIDVWTNQGTKIGTFKENLSQGGFGTTVYSVEDAAGNEIATSTKSHGFFSGTQFDLANDSGVGTTIKRTSQFPLDVWSVSVTKDGMIDPRMLVMIAAFKTGHDNDSD